MQNCRQYQDVQFGEVVWMPEFWMVLLFDYIVTGCPVTLHIHVFAVYLSRTYNTHELLINHISYVVKQRWDWKCVKGF